MGTRTVTVELNGDLVDALDPGRSLSRHLDDALFPDGTPCATTIFRKRLTPPGAEDRAG
jgi:hypothetical protein